MYQMKFYMLCQEKQIGHRTPEISSIIEEIIEGIKNLLYTENKNIINVKSSFSHCEMGTNNSVIKGVLHAVNGAFSKEWLKISRQFKYSESIDYNWGKAIKVEDMINYCQQENLTFLQWSIMKHPQGS